MPLAHGDWVVPGRADLRIFQDVASTLTVAWYELDTMPEARVTTAQQRALLALPGTTPWPASGLVVHADRGRTRLGRQYSSTACRALLHRHAVRRT